MTDHILRVRGIVKAYPGVKALDGVDLTVGRGEIHGLMGENGAGKSTLIKVLSGAIRPDSGTIEFDGRQYAGFDPDEAMEAGIGVIYQEFNLVPWMSVSDNIFLGQEIASGPFLRRSETRRRAKQLLSDLGIDIDPDREVSELTVAYQQMVEIAKAISRKARLLIMDEPTAPLSNREVDSLKALVRRLQAQGITIIYISHRLEEIFELTSTVTVLRDGRYVGEIETAKATRANLISMMVGRDLTEVYPKGAHNLGEEVLSFDRVSGKGFRDVSFRLRRGEILGVGGLVGSGRTEVARAAFGADPATGGTIRVDGRAVHIGSPEQAMALGIGLIPEDRKQQGLLLSMSVQDNTTLPSLKSFSTAGFLKTRAEAAAAAGHIQRLRIRTPGPQQLVQFLSGGNQQKVVLAKWLETSARVLIFDEPTRGVDVGAKQEIYRLMADLAAQGYAIIMISSEMPELIGMSDRILVMARGRVSGELSGEKVTQEGILELAAL